MIIIYLITDKDGLKYVGSTCDLNRRISVHKCSFKKGDYRCSSSKLDLTNFKVDILDYCESHERKKVEGKWINKIDCVNSQKNNYDDLEYKRHRNKWIQSWGFKSENSMFYIQSF